MHYLTRFLNLLYGEYNDRKYLSSDPLQFPHLYTDPWDQEAVALIGAVLAYGKARQIQKSVRDLLERMSRLAPTPRAFIEKQDQVEFRRKSIEAFSGWVHRFNTGPDMVLLFGLLARSWKEHGSLGNHFLSHLKPGDADIGPALSLLMAEWREQIPKTASTGYFNYLLTSPADGSCCKRWCMLLRWLGRKDDLDLGLWTPGSPLISSGHPALKPEQLILPLDTHVTRISQYLGLTQRKTFVWKTAQEITNTLKLVDPKDPTRYDFALSRLGILDLCRRSYREEICKKCQLLPACKFAKNSSQNSTLKTPEKRLKSPS